MGTNPEAPKTVFCVMKNMDETEGKGPVYNVGTFSNDAAAKLAASGIDPYDRNAKVEAVKVYDNFQEWVHDIKPNDPRGYNPEYYKLRHKLLDPGEQLRLQSLAKLTPEEAAALGFKKD